jgi:hypothetical protein
MPILSPSWLAETLKCIVCHNHEQSLQFDHTIFDSLDPRSFAEAKRNLLDRGILSKQLLRRLWARLNLDQQAYKNMRTLLTKFEVAIELEGTGSLLVPTFLPQFLPTALWAPECALNEVQLQWWYAIRAFQPSGLMERMIVLLQKAGYTQFQCAKEGIVMLGAGGCRILCELAHNSEFDEQGIRVSVRGPKAKQGVAKETVEKEAKEGEEAKEAKAKSSLGLNGWQHARRVLSCLDKLLQQWPGMMVFKYVVTERQNGQPVYVPLLQVQLARKQGQAMVPLPHDSLALVQEEVAVEKLLGPLDLNNEDGEIAEAAVDVEEDESEEDEAEATIDAHGTVSGSKENASEEEEEFENYRVIIESMQQQGQQWIMLSYCWGQRNSRTGQYLMQQQVIKVFRRLVHTHGLPVWLDVFGGMQGDVYESMAKGVRGAALVVPFLSAAYDQVRV